MSFPVDEQRRIDHHASPPARFLQPGPPALGEDGKCCAQVAVVPNAIRTVLVDPLCRNAISAAGLRFAAQPEIEPDRRRQRGRRVQIGEQAPCFVQVPAHDAGYSADSPVGDSLQAVSLDGQLPLRYDLVL